MARLTNTGVGKIKAPEKGKIFVYDDHPDAPKGFALKVTAAGSKVFTLRYTMDGKQRLKTIGEWSSQRTGLSVEAARAEAARQLRGVHEGKDPLEEARRRRFEPTVRALADEWLGKHVDGLASAADIRRYVSNDILPALGKRKVSDVTRRDVLDIVEAKAEAAPRAAAILLRTCRQFLDYAVDREIIVANPATALKPSNIKTPRNPRGLQKVVRDRVLSDAEVKGVWQGIEASGMDRLTALALKFILTTGARPGEVAGAAWIEIEGRRWTVPAQRRGKTGRAYVVHLTDTALAILKDAKAEVSRRRKRRGGEDARFVFESRKGKPITRHALSRAVARLDPKPDWTPHDLRRTMRTGLSAAGVRPDIAELAIGHERQGIIGVYDKFAFEGECADALQRWEARLIAATADNVVALPKARVS